MKAKDLCKEIHEQKKKEEEDRFNHLISHILHSGGNLSEKNYAQKYINGIPFCTPRYGIYSILDYVIEFEKRLISLGYKVVIEHEKDFQFYSINDSKSWLNLGKHNQILIPIEPRQLKYSFTISACCKDDNV